MLGNNKNQMQATAARYRATHPFLVTTSPDQLSFSAGDILIVDMKRQHNGWVWAHFDGHQQTRNKRGGGWVPLSYMVQCCADTDVECPTAPGQQLVTPNNAPWFASAQPQTTLTAGSGNWYPSGGETYQNDSGGFLEERVVASNNHPNPFGSGNDGDSDGFGGAAMGGEWTSSKHIPVQTPSNEVKTESTKNMIRGLGGKIGSGLKGVGTSLHKVGKNAGSSIRTGTQKAASACGSAAKETKHRVDDMKQQFQQGQGNEKQTQVSITHKKGQRRTQGEQMKVNAANGAARGALVGGTVGFVLSGGNVACAVNSAKTHAVYGGAYGAASGWKPFGN